MKYHLCVRFFIALSIPALISCENTDNAPDEEKQPIELTEGWDGFILDGEKHHTPNAFIEVYGENLDNLSSNYDVSFTDGSYSDSIRGIVNYSVLLYFDINSPKLDEFEPGTYVIENTISRKPGNIVQSFIMIPKGAKIFKYPVFDGSVTVIEESGNLNIQYNLKTYVNKKETSVSGQYQGNFIIKDQTRLK